MPADPWDEIEDAFTRGLHASEADRAALLANIDGEVAVCVRSLWADSERAGSFLERGVVASARGVSHSPGELIGGRFRLVDFLGAGGMGEVFRARDEQLGRSVALKFLNSELASQDDTRHRLEHEARAICSLSHPHICTLYDIGWEGNAPFLVMEYLDGETLGDTLSRGPLSLTEIAPLALQMIDGLAHAHEAEIVHRDFKPGNVMLTLRGAKIFDFGIAKQLHTSSVANLSPALTNVGAILGSASYMSPEQAEGKPIDARSDIFSLGCVLYEMITGRKAFGSDSPISTLAAVLHSDPAPIRSLVPGTPAYLIELVEKCLKKNVEDRYQRLDEVRPAMAKLSAAAPAVAGTSRNREEPSFASTVLRLAGNRPIMIGVIVALVSLGAFSFLYLTSASLEATDSIAVLPFANVEKDTNLDYLADGLSESITNTLSRLGSVRVIPRATAFAYEGKEADVRKLGKDLNVRTIVTGRVSRTRDRFRVQAELVDARAGNQMWGQHYEGTSEDMLRVQDDIVRNVSQRLDVDVSDASRQELTRTSTARPEAYELYLRGRYALSRSTVADTQKSIEFFQQALRVDPTYPLAYAGLADSYFGLSGMYLKPKEAMAKAMAAATRAIELDPRLVEAHVSKGAILALYDFAWRESEDELKRAIELEPYAASARLWYAWNLVLTGRPDEGIAQAQRAHELDPLSAFIEAGLAQMYYCAGQPQEAIQRLRSVVGADPNFFNARYLLGVAHLYTAEYSDAIRELEHATRLDPQQPQPIGYLVYAYAKQGDLPSARARLAALKTLSESRYASGYFFAVASVGLGADDEAIQWLQRAYDDRDDMLSLLKVDSPFARLRSDPRVVSLLRQIGLD